MRNTFKVLFYIKKNAPLRNGNTPIMGRITINGQRTQLSTQLSVNPNLWDVSMGRAAGRSAVASHVNEQLSQIRFRIERCYNTLFYEHALVTPKMVKEMYFGNDQRNETLNIGVFTSISKTTSTTNSTARICCSKNSTKSS